MIKVQIISGKEAIKEYKRTGKIPSGKWLESNGGIITEKTFNTQEEYDAYVEGVNDCDGWSDYHLFPPETVENNPFHKRIGAIKKELLDTIRTTLMANNRAQVDISEVDDPSYVVWWDNHNNPYENQVLKVGYDDSVIFIQVETDNDPVTLYESDFALQNPDWLCSILDNINETINKESPEK